MKKIKSTKTILKKKQNKTKKKKTILGKKKKNMWGKLKLNFQPAQYWKNKFDKDNFKKISTWRNTAAKQKRCGGNTVAIHNILFLNYKVKFSTNSIFKKIDKDNFEKKKKKVNFEEKKRKKNVRQKKKRENKEKNKYVGKANLYQAYHHDRLQNQSSLFDIHNIIITMF